MTYVLCTGKSRYIFSMTFFHKEFGYLHNACIQNCIMEAHRGLKLKCNPVYCIYMSPSYFMDNMKIEMQSSNLYFHIHVWPFYDHIKIKLEKLSDILFSKSYHAVIRTLLNCNKQNMSPSPFVDNVEMQSDSPLIKAGLQL